ncbi:serine hydrolase domain-containing protein [Microbacterium sp. NPDC058342]|uniref:serine hydrolase domain-containing protein n=1 Tax=Microbacterium sp. NPDC058342 TaxID=3346454 RepID=UPI00365CD8A1
MSSHLVSVTADAIHHTLARTAEDLLNYDILGVAAQLVIPGIPEPITVASGPVSADGDRPLTGSELYPIGSQSKTFTAACVLLLAREGAIRLTDPISRYLPGLPIVDDSATIEQFLMHTSGIGDFVAGYLELPHPMPSFTFDELMTLARVQGKRFEAGSRYEYCNTDIVVLARMCELVTGTPFEQLLRQRIFEPLGMHDTFAAAGQPLPRERMARGYYVPENGYVGPPIDTTALKDFSVASASGNIVSSLPDMLRWTTAMQSPENPTGLSVADFVVDPIDAGSTPPHWFSQGLGDRGIEGIRWAGRTFWGHRGGFYGYLSATFFDPESGISFASFMTMTTRRGIIHIPDETQAYNFQTFLQLCATTAMNAVESPQPQPAS